MTLSLSSTEPDPKYWAPELTDKSLNEYRERYKLEGKFPPKLTDDEKKIVDRDGQLDEKGNRYAVSWNLGGHPTSEKIGKNGHHYHDHSRTGIYTRHTGCFGIDVLVE